MYWNGNCIFFSSYTDNYRPWTKLRNGNVFSCIRQSFCPQGRPHVNITHVTLDLTVWRTLPLVQRSLDIRHGTPLLETSSGHHCRPVQTCSFGTHRGDSWWWPLKQYMVCKWVVCIPLECFLVDLINKRDFHKITLQLFVIIM